MLDKIAPYYKAVTAVVIAFLGSLATALQAGSEGGAGIVAVEWISATIIALVAGGAVFAVPNRDPLAQHQDQSVQPPYAGA